MKKIVNLDGEVCIDGYYNFKLQRLKSKWDELVAIVNSNVSLLGDASLIKDFLCYLIDFLQSTQKELSIVVDNGSFRLFNQSGRLLPVINLICPSTLEDQVVINAICIKPQNVKLYCDKKSVCSELLELLNYLFDVKIVENS